MSTQISLFEDGAKVPAYLQKMELDAVTKALMGSGSGKRISIRGSVFRMMVDGKEVAVNEDRSMNVVVVNANNGVSRSYFSGAYVEGEHATPDCASDDGTTPRADSKDIQSSKCATCPQNIKGSSSDGKGRACGFSQRLAVVLDNDLEGDVYQLNLPSQSIFGGAEQGKMPLQTYVKLLASNSVPITAVVTEMRFDTSSSTPKLTFRAIRPLTQAEMAQAKEQGESEAAIQAVSAVPGALDSSLTDEEEETFETAKTKAKPKQKPIEETAEEKPPVKRTKAKEEPVVTEEPEVEVDAKVKGILEEIDDWDD